MKSTLLSILLALISLCSFSQITEDQVKEIAKSDNEGQLVMEASTLMQEGYLYYAEIVADRLLEINPESSNYNYRKGFLMLSIRKDYAGATPHFEKAILDTDPNYDMYSPKEKSAAVDAHFHLATCYHLNEDIVSAEEQYNLFKLNSKKKSELLPVVELRLKQCTEAKKQMAAPVNVYLKNIGSQINTSAPEYSPVISLDGSALYFTSRRPWANGESDDFIDPRINQYPEDVYVSYMDFDSTWTEPIRLDFCKARQNEATIAVSSDERKLYLYEDSTGNGDIYYTDFYHAQFQDIQKLETKNVNTKFWETHAMMSHDKKTLFFVSDRNGGFGGRDIYMCQRNTEKDKWEDPVNLGPSINGPDDEDAPFISIDNKTLYFATNGERSIGGFDIMQTTMNVDGSWAESSNLGYPFNSTNDDIFYTTTLDGRRGYMTSFRKDGNGEKDIYEIFNDYLGVKDVAILRGLIKTVDDKPLPEDFAINVKLVCLDCDPSNTIRQVFPRLRDGVFMTGLEPCKTYRLEYTDVGEDKMLHDDTFTTLCDTNYQEIFREVLLDVDQRKIINVEPVIDLPVVDVPVFVNLEFMHYFGYNKNKLTTSKGDLKKFVKDVEAQLEDGREEITVNVFSSASNVPTKTFNSNIDLAKVRAENMKYDIISYFEGEEKYKGKVNVVIVSSKVQGPAYDRDSSDKDKYKPYQFVGLTTE